MSSDESPADERFTTRRVALVGGDGNAAEMLHLFFQLMELECSLVAPGHGAVSDIRRVNPDVVILDLDLPDLRALEIARELQGLPTIFLTGGAAGFSPPKLDDGGRRAVAFQKPRCMEDLLRLFELLLDLRR